ncbi:hypothetical protein, partial [Brevibacillus sp. HD1.4A]
FTDTDLLSRYQSVTPDQQQLLQKLTPLIPAKMAEIHKLAETMDIQAATPLPPTQYTEKEQEFHFARSKTESSVDDVYRAANLVEQDVYLQGKHG